jgi:hypothetical protein
MTGGFREAFFAIPSNGEVSVFRRSKFGGKPATREYAFSVPADLAAPRLKLVRGG